jgi:hypothetical protein
MRKCLIFLSVMLFALGSAGAQEWWSTDYSYRVAFNVSAGLYDRTNPVVIQSINFTSLLRSKGDYDAFDTNSIRLISASSEAETPYQFDQVSNYNVSGNAAGNITFVVDGDISSGGVEAYYLYFDSGSGKSAPSYSTTWGSVTTGSNIIENEVIRSQWQQFSTFGPGISDFLIKSSSRDQCNNVVNVNSRIDGYKPDAKDWVATIQSTEIENGAVRKRMMIQYSGGGYTMTENITLYKGSTYLAVDFSHDAAKVYYGFWGTPGGDSSSSSTDTTVNGTSGSYDYRGVYDNVNSEGYELIINRNYIDTNSWSVFEQSGRYGFDVNMTSSSLRYFVIAITAGSSEISLWPSILFNPVAVVTGSTEYAPVCGDSICDSAKGESEANCWSDCHVVVCGDGLCETGETSGSCPTDCAILVSFQQPAQYGNFSRGDIISIKVKLSNPKGIDIQDATVSSRINFPSELTLVLHDDGAHADAFPDDAIYGGQISVPSTTPPGNYTLSITASKWGNQTTSTINISVRDGLVTVLTATNETYFKGYDIELSGSLKSMQDVKKTEVTLDVYFIHDTWSFIDTVTTDSNADFSYVYPILFSDPNGIWTVTVNGTDSYNNTASSSLEVTVVVPSQVVYYDVRYSAPPGSIYSRGSTVNLGIYVRRGDNPITDANVSYRDPSGNKRYMNEVSDGIYEDSFVIPMDARLGNWTLAIQATKYENGTLRAGATSPMTIEIRPMNFNYELIEPSRFNFVAGETINLLISITFENGTPVSGAIVTTETPSGDIIVFDEQDINGYYSASYTPSNIENGSWSMSVLAQDGSGNFVSVEKKILIREDVPLVPPWGWIIIISIIMGVLVFWKVSGETRYYTMRYHKLKEERDRIEMMKGIVEERYFNRQIDEDTYTKLMREHEEQSVGVISKLQEIQEKTKQKPKKGEEKKIQKIKKISRKKKQPKQEAQPEKKAETPSKISEDKPDTSKSESGSSGNESGSSEENSDNSTSFEDELRRAKQAEDELRDMQG